MTQTKQLIRFPELRNEVGNWPHRGGAARSCRRVGTSPSARRDAESEAGFTLLELLVVLGILALLATFAAPQVLRYLGKARTETAKLQINAIPSAVDLYALDNGGYPTQQ